MQLATPACPITREEVYIHGTEPTEFCSLHGGHMASDSPPGSWLSRIFGGDKQKGPESTQPLPPGENSARPTKIPGDSPGNNANGSRDDANKKGLFKRIFGIFGGKKDPINRSRLTRIQGTNRLVFEGVRHERETSDRHEFFFCLIVLRPSAAAQQPANRLRPLSPLPSNRLAKIHLR